MSRRFSIIPEALRGKLAAMTGVMCLVTAVLVGLAGDYKLREVTVDAALDSLGNEARLMGLRFRKEYEEMQTHAVVVARTPPIQGLMRSMAHSGRDPYDGSSTTQWRMRLSTIFESIMTASPHYTQMRYISAADGAPELVRVNRADDGFERVLPGDLQWKGKEPYVIEGLKLAQGEAYFSNVTFNREHGRVDAASTPTLRIATPVHAPDGSLFGLIVINADFEKFLVRAFEQIAPEYETYVIDPSFGYMVAAPGMRTRLEIFDDLGAAPVLAGLDLYRTDGAFKSIGVASEFAAYRASIDLPASAQGGALSVVVRRPLSELLAPSDHARTTTLFVVLALTVAATIAAVVMTGTLLLPLTKITERLTMRDTGADSLGLPVERHDEIGELARAFERKARQLRRSELHAKDVVDTATDGIITIDHHGVVQTYNAACRRIFGFSAEEMIGKNVSKLMPASLADVHDDNIRRYQDTGEKKIIGIGRELEGRRKNGTLFPMELSIAETTIDGRTVFTGIVRDISERKILEAEKERLIEKLEESNAELESFAYVASHDLKAPLRAIDNTSSWLAEDLAEALDGENLENMEFLRSRVQRMDKLLDDLLEYSRVGRKLDARYSEAVEGARLMEDVISLQNAPDSFDITVSSSFSSISLDRMPLQQIMHNLVSNALKHHDRTDGRIEIDVKDLGAAYGFTVKDDGPGIPAQFHEQIFNMFQTLQPRDKVEGSGMGLAIVKKLVSQRNGAIRVESKEGAGTTFFVTWPKANGWGDANVEKPSGGRAVTL